MTEIALIVVAIIAVSSLSAICILLLISFRRMQAFLMGSKDPRAYTEVMKSISDRSLERTEKKKAQHQAAAHKRFKDAINRGEATDNEIREFGGQKVVE